MASSGATGAAGASEGTRTSLGSQHGTGAPTQRAAHPGAPHGCPSRKCVPVRLWAPRCRRLPGAACAQHRVAAAAGGLSPRQSAAVRSPQLRSHPQAGAGRGEVAGPSRSRRMSQQQHLPSALARRIPPPSALVAPQRDGSRAGDTGGVEVCSCGWKGSSQRKPTHCPCHHPTILLRGHCRGTMLSWGDIANRGLPRHGLLQPQGQAAAGREGAGGRGLGLSWQPAVTPQEPSRSAALRRGWGFSQFPHAAETLPQSESRGVS